MSGTAIADWGPTQTMYNMSGPEMADWRPYTRASYAMSGTEIAGSGAGPPGSLLDAAFITFKTLKAATCARQVTTRPSAEP
eukprot:2394794-Rhodomonas_salina.2